MTEERGDRYNEGKVRWSLVDFPSLEPMVRVLMFGAEKYSAHNWKKGLPVTEICDSMMRHITAFLAGENDDPESGISHVGHIQCNAMFLAYMMKNRKDLDDRQFVINFKTDVSQLDLFSDDPRATSHKQCCGDWDENGTCTCKNHET